MLQVADEFHTALINKDKVAINHLLTDNFTETGARHFIQTPQVTNKNQVLGSNNLDTNCRVELNYLIANIFGNDSNSLHFERNLILTENGKTTAVNSYFVTYVFEKDSDGLKISKSIRNF